MAAPPTVIVGAGVVGTAFAKSLRAHGHEVALVDRDEARVASLRRDGWNASRLVELGDRSAVIFLAVPTPADVSGYDLTDLVESARAVGAAISRTKAPQVVVVRSTVPPGTCDDLIAPVLEAAARRSVGDDLVLASSPEFLRNASADEDALHPRLNVIGTRSARGRELLRELFESLGGEVVVFGDPTTAELVKCAHNAWNATKISFFNQLWMLSRRLDVDSDAVAATIVRSADASRKPRYGTKGGRPFEGPCLTKDLDGLMHFSTTVGVPAPMFEAVAAVNRLLDGSADDPVTESR